MLLHPRKQNDNPANLALEGVFETKASSGWLCSEFFKVRDAAGNHEVGSKSNPLFLVARGVPSNPLAAGAKSGASVDSGYICLLCGRAVS